MSRPVPMSSAAAAVDPRLEHGLRWVALTGLVLSLLLPWRSEWLGVIPLWLVGMPLSAWWALHRFRWLPRVRVATARRRVGMQARLHRSRMGGQGFASRLSRAA